MSRFNIISQERQNLLSLLPLKKPLSMFIETTNICNFRCSVCIQGAEETRKDLAPFKHMDFSDFKKIIEDIKSWNGPKLKLLRLAFHGEPFMQKDFAKFAKFAVDSQVAEKIDTFSNASLMDKEQANAILESGIDAIRFSIYSVINDRHKEVTRRDVPVEAIRDNILYLKEERYRRGLDKPFIFVKAFDNYNEENDLFFSMYKDIADKVDLEKVHNATKYKDIDLMGKYYKNSDVKEQNKENFSSNLHNFIACPRPFMSMVVNVHGNCLMCTLDAPSYTKIGNIHEKHLQEIWSGKEAFEFRKLQLEGNKEQNSLCRACDWFKLFPVEDCVDSFPVERLSEF